MKVICNNCFVCSQPISGKSEPYNDIGWTDYGVFHGLRIFHCDFCGFGFSAPELPEKTVNYYYEKQYRAKYSTFYIDFNKSVSDGIGDIRNNRSFAQITLARAFCEFNAEDIFLDIGPGKGGSFKTAKALFQRPQLCGIELSQGAREFYRKNYDAVCYQSVKDFIRSGKKAKVLLMSHSLEHYRLSELPELFLVLTTALAKDGVLVIEVPNVDLRIHSEIRGVDIPHFLFFSRQSLALMLDTLSFNVLFMDTCGEKFRSTIEQELISNSLSSKIKNYLKLTYNKLPIRLQITLRTLVRNYQRARGFKLTSKNEMNNLAIHSYGGNRDCIRLVARKK